MGEAEPGTEVDTRALYLEIVKRALTAALTEDSDIVLGPVRTLGKQSLKFRAADKLGKAFSKRGLELAYKRPYDAGLRDLGRDWPSRADTMIGIKRMGNIQQCVESVLTDGVPGDLIETGVWRGGATIFMRAILKAYGDTSRTVWVADSFEGLPPPDPIRYPADTGDGHFGVTALNVGVDEVRRNFERFGLLDDQVKFLVGWFKDTLPTAPIEQLSVLRLDGDLYESTIQAIEALYPKLSAGGYCIVDDYGSHVEQCQRAIHDYRDANGIREPIEDIDGFGAFWRKAA